MAAGPCVLEEEGGEHTPEGWLWDVPGTVIEGIRLAGTKLHSVGAGLRDFDPRLPVVRDMVLEDCELRASVIGLVVIAESTLHFRRTAYTNLFGTLFDRTVVRGRFGSLIVQDAHDRDLQRIPAFEVLRRRFYAEVPWALDLREARFTSPPNIRNIPGSKMLLDPVTQGVAWRAPTLTAIRDGTLRDDHPWWASLHYSFDGASWGGRDFTDYDDVVLVTPVESRKRKHFQQGLDDLRAKGIVR